MKLILQKIKCDVIGSSARLSLKKCTCMFSLNAKTTQLHCVFMHNICKRKEHLLYETHNLHYLLIYTGFGCFDVLLLTSDTVFYRNEKKMGQSLNRGNPIQSTGEGRSKELFTIVLCCWNSVWKRRQLRREGQKPPY